MQSVHNIIVHKFGMEAFLWAAWESLWMRWRSSPAFHQRPQPSAYKSGKSNKKNMDLVEGFERLTANAEVATVLGSIPTSSDTNGIWGAADEVVLSTAHRKENPKSPPIYIFNYYYMNYILETLHQEGIVFDLRKISLFNFILISVDHSSSQGARPAIEPWTWLAAKRHINHLATPPPN